MTSSGHGLPNCSFKALAFVYAGNPEVWVAPVRPGRILFEIEGVEEETARRAMELASAKLPIKTKFVERL